LLPGNLSFRVDSTQHIGSRETQQDHFAVAESSCELVVVLCDGMSGSAASDDAARIATQAFLEAWSSGETEPPAENRFEQALGAAQWAILDLGARQSPIAEAGTTLLAAAIGSGGVEWVSVGDSPLFLLSDGKLEALNALHRKVSGPPSSYLGAARLVDVDRGNRPVSWQKGDILLLASDGLTQSLSLPEIERLLSADTPASARNMVRHALAVGTPSQDNITVVMVRGGAI
jgi:protein phosphatase